MKPSSFQTTIENQFDYICKRAMEDERKNYMLYLSRIAKREVSFS
ncbi:TPA: sigma-70 family RNA polymerase sigma factor, partial [Clostridioides difficile]